MTVCKIRLCYDVYRVPYVVSVGPVLVRAEYQFRMARVVMFSCSIRVPDVSNTNLSCRDYCQEEFGNSFEIFLACHFYI